MPQKSYPDYYRMLQVHPEAEQEVIQAAFHRLMRKYHPDILDHAQKNSPEIQQKVRELNDAYAVLGDPAKRKQYDSVMQLKNEAKLLDSSAIIQFNEKPKETQVEKVIYQVKCAKTKKRFQMLLARRRNSGGLFQVMGFQNAPDSEEVSSKPILGFPSEDELEAVFEESLQLTMSNIDWSNSLCPGCQTSFTISAEKGVRWNWIKCGSCAQLFCGSGLYRNFLGEVCGKCPWCGHSFRYATDTLLGFKNVSAIKGGAKLDKLSSGSQQPKLPDAQNGNFFKLPGNQSEKKNK
jgi:DnaJ-class molecular chaperone